MIPNLTNASETNINTILKTLEERTGCKFLVTSANRSVEHNRRVGGVKNSYHLKKNSALDIIPKDRKCISLRLLATVSCEYASVIKYPRHIHIDNRKDRICIKGKYKKGLTLQDNRVIIQLNKEIKALEEYIDEILNDMEKVKELNTKLDDLEILLVMKEDYYTLRLV